MPRVGRAFVGTLALANLALWMGFFTPIQLLLPEQLEDISGDAGKVGTLGWVTGAGAVVAVVVTPLAGALSNRTVSRYGRRLPWVVGGTVLAALALAVLSRQSTLAGVLVGWCVAQGLLNAAYAGLTAEVPDHVPVAQRGTVSGWFGLPQAVGVVVGVVLVTSLTTSTATGYLVVAAAIVLLVLPFATVTRDARLSRRDRPQWSWRGWWVSPRRHPDFGWAWLTRFLISLGNALGTLYLLYFLRDEVHYEPAEDGVLILILIYAAGAVATAVTGGMWSDRTGRRKPLVIASSLVMASGALLLAVSPDVAGGAGGRGAARHRVRRVHGGGHGAGDRGAAGGGRPGQGPRHRQHRQRRPAGARARAGRAGGGWSRRLPGPVWPHRAGHRGRRAAGAAHPLGPLRPAQPSVSSGGTAITSTIAPLRSTVTGSPTPTASANSRQGVGVAQGGRRRGGPAGPDHGQVGQRVDAEDVEGGLRTVRATAGWSAGVPSRARPG